MKWKNIDIGAAYYYITGTFTEWLPLFRNSEVREIVTNEIMQTLNECSGIISAFAMMPDHLHMLVYLPEEHLLHRFNKLWRGRSAHRITKYAEQRGSKKILEIIASHANGHSRYAVWKEQVRSLPIYSRDKLYAMINYIHANPVRRRLAQEPEEWEFSSWRFYERGERVVMDITPLVI